jgi:hypothetical protein
MAYEAPGIIVRSENEAHVGTADRGASALHLANTISFRRPAGSVVDTVETDEDGRAVLTFVAGGAALVLATPGRCAVPAVPPPAGRPTG